MKIIILSRNPKCYSTRRLLEAAKQRNHNVTIMNPLKFGIFIEQETPYLTYKKRMVTGTDAIIPRIGATITFFGTAVVRQFEQMGTFSLNNANAIAVSRDKLRSMQTLSRHKIGIPATAFVRDQSDVLPAIKRVGGMPVIIKLLEGTQGVGVILADTLNNAIAIIETLHSRKQNVLIQKFVKESRGRDIRAFVVGNRVVAAMRRRAAGIEFRSNVHRGGTTEKIVLDEAFERTAVLATQILGLRVAGVDMLESDLGPQVMEINSSPGLEGIETITKVDIAGAILEYLAEQVQFKDIDIRQKLTFPQDYIVAEVPIHPRSPLTNQTLVNSGLRARNIMVLAIDRKGSIIPNPTPNREILAGDNLLCYGKQLSIRGLLADYQAPNPESNPVTNS